MVAVHDAGRFYSKKSDTTVDDLCRRVVAALENLAPRIGVSLGELLAGTTRFVNGTTSGNNSIAELKGAEELIAGIIEHEHRDLFLSVSSRLHPKVGEYERTMTTVLNAFTGIRVAQCTRDPAKSYSCSWK